MNLILISIATLCGLIYLLGYYSYSIKQKKHDWINQYIGSYVFWCHMLPNKKVRYSLLICYIVFWLIFTLTLNHWLIIFSCIVTFFIGLMLVDKPVHAAERIHNGILQMSTWTAVIFVIVRFLPYWYISILAVAVPLIPYFINKYITLNHKNLLPGETITFDILWFWLALFTLL